jgi:hypothetical protein
MNRRFTVGSLQERFGVQKASAVCPDGVMRTVQGLPMLEKDFPYIDTRGSVFVNGKSVRGKITVQATLDGKYTCLRFNTDPECKHAHRLTGYRGFIRGIFHSAMWTRYLVRKERNKRK